MTRKYFYKEHSFLQVVTFLHPLLPPGRLHFITAFLYCLQGLRFHHTSSRTPSWVFSSIRNVRSGVERKSAGLHLTSRSAEVAHQCQEAGPREGGQKPATAHLFSFKGHCTGCRHMSGSLHLKTLIPHLLTDGFTTFHSISSISFQSLNLQLGDHGSDRWVDIIMTCISWHLNTYMLGNLQNT